MSHNLHNNAASGLIILVSPPYFDEHKTESAINKMDAKFDSFYNQFIILKWIVGGMGFTLFAATIIILIKYVFFLLNLS